MAHFDLLIVGTGSGNSVLTAEHEHWEVGIVERDVFGGTCLNRGCIPSKMLVVPANRVVEAAEAEALGVAFGEPQVDWPGIRDRIFGRIDPIAGGGEQYREGQEHVTVLRGEARMVDSRTVSVLDAGGNRSEHTADRIVLAAGARPWIPDIEGLAVTPFHTSDTIMRIEEVPEHLMILGGGFIAAELGHVFAALGSKVSVIHRGARLLRHLDVDLSTHFTREFARRAYLHLRTEVTRVDHVDGEFTLTLDSDHPGHSPAVERLTGDALLVTTGRIPNGAAMDVEAAGVHLDAGGYVRTDDTLSTGVEGIWALGDIRNPAQLKHLANQEARVVSHNLVHPDDPVSIDQRVVPHAVFSHPEVASVGAREVDLEAQRVAYRVGTCGYGDVAYGWALEDTGGFAKVLVSEDSGEVLGAHVLGYAAATLVQQVAQAMQFRIPAERLAREQVWCHPALPELLENALLDAVGT
ncbi:MAG: mycothione reductase [Microthrixaceae bacterium]|nr:mycothione reductase [Microthrixaceae bacterium]